jgi:hypothetical protein
MIEKVVTRWKLGDPAAERAELTYWLRRSPEERIAAVEFLRRQMHGDSARLQRVARLFRRGAHGELVDQDLAARKAEGGKEPETES